MLADVDHVFFDLFGTLLDLVDEDTEDLAPYEDLARFLFLRGVDIDAVTMRDTMRDQIAAGLAEAGGAHPDVDMRDVFATLLEQHLRRDEHFESRLEEAALVFRVASTAAHEPVRGMIAVVRDLAVAGMPVSLISNTQRLYSTHEVRAIGLDTTFEVIVFSSDVRACKPGPAPFLRGLELTAVDPARALYVGDNPVDDVVGSAGVGMRSVLFDRGRERPRTGPEPVAVVRADEPERVLELVGVDDG